MIGAERIDLVVREKQKMSPIHLSKLALLYLDPLGKFWVTVLFLFA